jgi:hypothetical protein
MSAQTDGEEKEEGEQVLAFVLSCRKVSEKSRNLTELGFTLI